MEIPKYKSNIGFEPRKVVEQPIQPKKIDEHVPLKEEFKDYTDIDPHKLKYEEDPIQDKVIKKKMSLNPQYALVMRTNETPLFFTWINKKLEIKENILLEICGYVRSGKSIVGQSIAKYISQLINKPFPFENLCRNESEYAQRVKLATEKGQSFNSVWVVDEQTESLQTEQKIRTEKGMVKLKNLKEGEEIDVSSFNFKNSRKEFVKAKKVRNNLKSTYKITTENGKTIEATEDHIFFVDRKGKIVEKRLRELKNGDKLICL